MGYKFSWSSKGVLLALMNTATYLKDNKLVTVDGGIDLMDCEEKLDIVDDLFTVGYPNRDSTIYKGKYEIPECNTCLRGTLRYKVISLSLLIYQLIDELFFRVSPQ
jgi:saccharopine dehydrogenase (NADP+, L-glutamate forming)